MLPGADPFQDSAAGGRDGAHTRVRETVQRLLLRVELLSSIT